VSRRAAKPQGSALVLALFVVAIIFTAGLGFAGQSKAQYRAAMQAGRAVEAMAVAEAGLEDALAKIRRDWDFPPRSADDQLVFSYQDTLTNSRGDVVGSYQVDIDRRAMVTPHRVLVVRSRGRLGPALEPSAERTLEIELDMDEARSSYFQILSWTDLGGF
jgi:hypothetical protein